MAGPQPSQQRPKSDKPAPQLPIGSPSTFNGLAESFAFHASPEAFLTQRVLSFAESNPDIVTSRRAVRAKILNRNVAVISSYAQIKQILEDQPTSFDPGNDDPTFAAAAAYDKFMGPFFPTPNLLLADGVAHAEMRGSWEAQMKGCTEQMGSFVQEATKSHFEGVVEAGGRVGLYECMKALAWRLLLGSFLSLRPDDADFVTIERLQEDLLRGQFSLFPVSVNAGLWRSPRKRGINAKSKLQQVILERLKAHGPAACPVIPGGAVSDEKMQEVADHVLLFTSSLAAKALASLLTAVFLNLYPFPQQSKAVDSGSNTASAGTELPRLDDQGLNRLILETERLSPPIVGIMRRAMQDVVLKNPGSEPDVLIPKGWDAWLYFVGAGRDPEAFGDDWHQFKPERHSQVDTPRPLAFGAGPKSCLGQHMMRGMIAQVARTCLTMNLKLTGQVEAEGVKAWLGWNKLATPEAWAKDLKQLPTQHATKSIMVLFSR